MAQPEERRAVWFVLFAGDPMGVEQTQRLFQDGGELRFAGGTARIHDVVRLVRENAAEVLVVEESAGGRKGGIAVAADLARHMPVTKVFLAATQPTAELLSTIRHAGLRGVVRQPFGPDELRKALLADREGERLQLALVVGGGGVAPSRRAGSLPIAEWGPKVLAVFSFKGGVGKTTIAVNLAVAARTGWARRWSTALVDADDGLGTAHVLLGVPAKPTLLSWEEYAGEPSVDPAVVQHKLVATLRTGLHAVFSSGRADQAVGVATMETILGTLRGMYALTVVDCGCEVSAAVLTAIAKADIVALVVDQTLGATEKAILGLQALAAAGVSTSKFRLLINVARSGVGGYRADELKAALQLQVIGIIPFEGGAKAAENRRDPLAVCSPHSRFMRALTRGFDPLLPGLAEQRRHLLPGRRP